MSSWCDSTSYDKLMSQCVEYIVCNSQQTSDMSISLLVLNYFRIENILSADNKVSIYAENVLLCYHNGNTNVHEDHSNQRVCVKEIGILYDLIYIEAKRYV